MSKRREIFTDPFPRELNPELFKPHIDMEYVERILEEEKKQERREKLKNLFKGRKRQV